MPYISRLSAGTYRVQWRDGAGRLRRTIALEERMAPSIAEAIELVCDAAEQVEGLTTNEAKELMEAVEVLRERFCTPTLPAGTVNAKGAVWRDGKWHLIKVVKAYGIIDPAAHATFYAQCSCDWSGPIHMHTHRGAEDLARSDGERHTGEAGVAP